VLVTVTLGILLRAAIVFVFTDRTRIRCRTSGSRTAAAAGGRRGRVHVRPRDGRRRVALFAALFVFLKVSPLGIRMRAAGERALLASQRASTSTACSRCRGRWPPSRADWRG